MKETRMAATTVDPQDRWNGIERRRVEKVVEALTALRVRGGSIAEVAHDARNMVTALTIYCDLLEVPGVLGSSFAHYAQELRLVAAASRRLVEKLLALDAGAAPNLPLSSLFEDQSGRTRTSANQIDSSAPAANTATPRFIPWPGPSAVCSDPLENPTGAAMASADPGNDEGTQSPGEERLDSRVEECADLRIGDRIKDGVDDRLTDRCGDRARQGDLLPSLPVANLGAEVVANGNLLAALAGPSITLTIDIDGGAQAVQLTAEDLTRVLVNLVKNAAEAMPMGGRIIIGLREIDVMKGTAPCLAMTIDDNGPGIPNEALEKIFVTGYTSRAKATAGIWPQSHRGLGLAIVRSIVEGAGGRITAANRPQGGASFTLELPVTKTGKSTGPGIVNLGRSRVANADRESQAASHSSRTADC